ncbi:hypothetical protein ACFY20_38630 [Streptomyces sp. NPDC001312]|uniref:hypothetical protein n=1 Tax=Streptomyces sp. NPDC001312 TaxID=3364561 RepID=UPI003678E6D8
MANGGGRHWNEETQRWEDGVRDVARATSPPPARPGHAPAPPPGEVRDPDAPTGAWPVAAPPAPPAVPGGHSRRTVWAVIGASAAVGVAVALVVTLGPGGEGHGDDRGAATASGTPATTAPPPTTNASPEPDTETPSPSPSAGEPPAGYAAYDDPEGFRIAVPDGWQHQRSTVSSQYGMDVVNYRDSTGRHRLQVYEVRESSPDESFDLYLSADVPKPPGFRTLSLVNLDSGDFTGSRLEYLADSLRGEPDIGTWHVVDERFRAADGRLYALASYGPESDGRDDEQEVLSAAVDWFCPSSATCGD